MPKLKSVSDLDGPAKLAEWWDTFTGHIGKVWSPQLHTHPLMLLLINDLQGSTPPPTPPRDPTPEPLHPSPALMFVDPPWHHTLQGLLWHLSEIRSGSEWHSDPRHQKGPLKGDPFMGCRHSVVDLDTREVLCQDWRI